jgi:hypothetical protein
MGQKNKMDVADGGPLELLNSYIENESKEPINQVESRKQRKIADTISQRMSWIFIRKDIDQLGSCMIHDDQQVVWLYEQTTKAVKACQKSHIRLCCRRYSSVAVFHLPRLKCTKQKLTRLKYYDLLIGILINARIVWSFKGDDCYDAVMALRSRGCADRCRVDSITGVDAYNHYRLHYLSSLITGRYLPPSMTHLISSAAGRHNELRKEIAALDYAESAFTETAPRLRDLLVKQKCLASELSWATEKMEKEKAEHLQIKHSVTNKWSSKLTGRGDQYREMANKEERYAWLISLFSRSTLWRIVSEYLEALEDERKAQAAYDAVNSDIEELMIEVSLVWYSSPVY